MPLPPERGAKLCKNAHQLPKNCLSYDEMSIKRPSRMFNETAWEGTRIAESFDPRESSRNTPCCHFSSERHRARKPEPVKEIEAVCKYWFPEITVDSRRVSSEDE
jgi:hypothetical protein